MSLQPLIRPHFHHTAHSTLHHLANKCKETNHSQITVPDMHLEIHKAVDSSVVEANRMIGMIGTIDLALETEMIGTTVDLDTTTAIGTEVTTLAEDLTAIALARTAETAFPSHHLARTTMDRQTPTLRRSCCSAEAPSLNAAISSVHRNIHCHDDSNHNSTYPRRFCAYEKSTDSPTYPYLSATTECTV